MTGSVCSIRGCKSGANNIPVVECILKVMNGRKVMIKLPMDARYCDHHKQIIGSSYDWIPYKSHYDMKIVRHKKIFLKYKKELDEMEVKK